MYELLMGFETAKEWEKAMDDVVYFMKNPIHDQPKQKWHTGDGFYRVIKAFGEVQAGDIILLQSYTHTRVVKIATHTEKQVFYNYDKNFNARMQFTPEQWQTQLKELTKRELFKIFPHLSDRIKELSGYYAIMKFYPENVCADCRMKLGLELRDIRWAGNGSKRCNNCGKTPIVTTRRNNLKPIKN